MCTYLCVCMYIYVYLHIHPHNWEREIGRGGQRQTGITNKPTFFKCLHLTNECITNHSRINKHFNSITIGSVVS